jgi:hypothetical protein
MVSPATPAVLSLCGAYPGQFRVNETPRAQGVEGWCLRGEAGIRLAKGRAGSDR